ncbi:Protein phosphatase 1 regulatory subunit 37 [Anabarilius grahami]|uniref:Protein phosphatase 1 regulatory subunit 37 n=1 Tax=Anabarilius grahami TaxID=495550 RepID=A0A3N0Z341_ANAGA|nr:Protein phosphatase 1 regulatory subunit 37 [Anabarilius grahami]
MNCEDQAGDLCNAIDLCNVPDNTISHEILPRDGLLLMDGDQGEGDAAVLARLKDIHLKDDGSTELKAPHSQNNGSIAVSADPVNGSAGDLNKFEEPPVTNCSVGDGGNEAGDYDDDSEMDIGVDLSLDENGILEFEPAQTQTEESASLRDNSLISETVIELHSQTASEERSVDVPSETVSTAGTPGEGVGIKQGSKRVTFPSDEDIVSGAVEPKDPWRHEKQRSATVHLHRIGTLAIHSAEQSIISNRFQSDTQKSDLDSVNVALQLLGWESPLRSALVKVLCALLVSVEAQQLKQQSRRDTINAMFCLTAVVCLLSSVAL